MEPFAIRLQMSERGILSNAEKEYLEDEYEGSDVGERSAKYRIRHRVEPAFEDLIAIAQSEKVEVDDEIWYRYIPALLSEVMAPRGDDNFIPYSNFEGSQLEHRKKYPLQYALLDRLIRQVDAYEQAFHSEGVPGGVITGLPDEIEEAGNEPQ